MNPFYKNLSMWLVIGLTMVLLFNLFNKQPVPSVEVSYSDFLAAVEKKTVEKVQIDGNIVTGTMRGGSPFKAIAPSDPEMISTLRESGVEIRVKEKEETPWYVTVLVSWFPMMLLIGVWIFFMRQMQGGGRGAMSFGKTRAKMTQGKESKKNFTDVAGVDEAKEELSEIIDFLRDPQKFTRLGGRIPKGVLLIGPPGTGKTLLAKAIAGEADVPFFSLSGSDFVEMFVGVGASRVRDLFTQGKKNAPCIIFIDEIDAVGRHRGAGLGGGHDEREQTLNQLLVEMDGFEANEGVIVIAATNRPDVLDPALLRPGRFDRQVVVPVPDVKGREMILGVYAGRAKMAVDVDWKTIARATPGFTGADLENMVNEAALFAARMGKEAIEMEDLEQAKDKVMMGRERRSMIITEEEKKITAYHEAGHALVARQLPGADPVHKVTIIPRGRALGLTQQLPTSDKYTHSRRYLKTRLAILMGGRVAEQLVFDEVTTGAGNDIEQATTLARKMVCEWGMSEAMGPLAFGKKEEQIFLGREIAQHRDFSESTAVHIDDEVRLLVTEALERATSILSGKRDVLAAMAAMLLERETIDQEDIDNLIDPERAAALAAARADAERAAQAEQEQAEQAQAAAGDATAVAATGDADIAGSDVPPSA